MEYTISFTKLKMYFRLLGSFITFHVVVSSLSYDHQPPNFDNEFTLLERREVQLVETMYVEPKWFQSMKSSSGKYWKRCQLEGNVLPNNGDKCRKLPTIGAYSCGFGDQTCSDGTVFPKHVCNCDSTSGLWSCEEYTPCERKSQPVTVCPWKHPITFNPPLTCVDGMVCPIGAIPCCSKVPPRYNCTCVNGSFVCTDSFCPIKCHKSALTASPTLSPIILSSPDPNPRMADLMLPPASEHCPELENSVPIPEGSICNLKFPMTCEYGTICCCDQCFSKTVCTCEKHVWQCRTLLPMCEICPLWNSTLQEASSTKLEVNESN